MDATAERVRATERAAELALERERDGKRRELDRLLQLCTRGILSEGEYVNARVTILAEIERLKVEINNPGRRQSEADARPKTALTLAASAERVFAEAQRAPQAPRTAPRCRGAHPREGAPDPGDPATPLRDSRGSFARISRFY